MKAVQTNGCSLRSKRGNRFAQSGLLGTDCLPGFDDTAEFLAQAEASSEMFVVERNSDSGPEARQREARDPSRSVPHPLTKTTDKVLALERVDWNFSNSISSRRSIHSFHSYPARFIPEIPRAFITALAPPKGTKVLDPFCGCGTTLVEAAESGLNAVGVDLNPIACLISRIKTARLPSTLVEIAKKCIAAAQAASKPALPSIPNLAHWFQDDVSDAIARLLSSITEVRGALLRDCLRASLSSIIVRISRQDSDTRYAAVQKVTSAALVYKLFESAVTNLSSLNPCKHSGIEVINKSIFDITPKEIGTNVSLVITSPPYPNAYEYWLYHKYRMWWLAYDPLKVKEAEIGARAHFFTSRRETENFESQMSAVFALLSKVVIKGGHCCFICGDSKIGGKVVDNSLALVNAASNNGFELIYQSERVLNQNRKSFNLHHARIKKEHVLVWRK